jgi:c-di-GMP-binding flagellar brake protein YcgR
MNRFDMRIDDISEFFRGIMEGLQSTTRQQTLIVLIIAGFVILLLGVYLVQRWVTHLRIVDESQKTFANALRNVDLTREERDYLEQLTNELPKKQEQKYLLVHEPIWFSRAAESLIQKGAVTPAMLKPLRQKLDVCCFKRERPLSSTKELPPGLHLYITEGTVEGYHARIVKQKHDLFAAVVRKQDAPLFTEGKSYTLFFKRRKNTYRFASTARFVRNNIVWFKQTEEIDKVQRRNYYRKKVALPVELEKSGYETYRAATRLIDLGGGGAKMENPHGMFKSGDLMRVLLKLPPEDSLEVGGEVVKTSDEGGAIHVRFDPIKPAQVDRILRYVMLDEVDEAPSESGAESETERTPAE